jgi:predicted nucleotidyltransferase
MKMREGDLVENKAGLIFDVKGLIHPPGKIIAFPRFIPDSHGTRNSKRVLYRKVYVLSERFQFLEQRFPHYLVYDRFFDERLCEVPVEDVRHHHKPVDRLRELRRSRHLDDVETCALEFCTLLKRRAKIPWSKIGITGSILVGLHTSGSDVDAIVYGSENCRRAYSALKTLLREESVFFKSYNREDLKRLFDFRSKDTKMDFVDFVRTESRKVLQGKFLQRDYFVRLVKDRNEVRESYGDVRYMNSGHSKLVATIVGDSESIFTPCVYGVDKVRTLEGTEVTPIEEIVSFRGRFCEQARAGETVVAQGKVERVRDSRSNREHFRILLGNSPSDYMALA